MSPNHTTKSTRSPLEGNKAQVRGNGDSYSLLPFQNRDVQENREAKWGFRVSFRVRVCRYKMGLNGVKSLFQGDLVSGDKALDSEKVAGVDLSCYIHILVSKYVLECVLHNDTSNVLADLKKRLQALKRAVKHVIVVYDGQRTSAKQETDDERGGSRSDQLTKIQDALKKAQTGSSRVRLEQAEMKAVDKALNNVAHRIPDRLASEALALCVSLFGDASVITAAGEADHELVRLFYTKEIDFVVTVDTDFIMYLVPVYFITTKKFLDVAAALTSDKQLPDSELSEIRYVCVRASVGERIYVGAYIHTNMYAYVYGYVGSLLNSVECPSSCCTACWPVPTTRK
jgi:hypothetical protein